MSPAPADSPFHAGEQLLQEQAGVRDRLELTGQRVIRDHMPDQHREFFAEQPFVIVGALDAQGWPWASVLSGRPGFMHSPDPHTLTLASPPLPGDPITPHWDTGIQVGLLGIQPHTRRRNRMNGTVVGWDGQQAQVRVRQSFGNCPKYIQPRRPVWDEGFEACGKAFALGSVLDERSRRLVETADTFFIASASGPVLERTPGRAEGVDVSHRGGPAGFVRVDVEQGSMVLTVPDYLGNFMFNTLGNVAVHPAVGLLFIDFDEGDLLHLQGQAQVVNEVTETARHDGAQRLLRIRVWQGVLRPRAFPIRWAPA